MIKRNVRRLCVITVDWQTFETFTQRIENNIQHAEEVNRLSGNPLLCCGKDEFHF